VRAGTLRTLERVASAPAPVDREAVRAKVAAEVARLDEAFAMPGGVLSVGEDRERARSVLRAMDADRLEEDDWRAIGEAYTVPS
jgi:hypothetical protein